MEYEGLTADDVTNVRALNRAWLRLATTGAGRVADADRRGKRLGDAPFLLFTLRESETELWSTLLGDQPQPDLFAACPEGGQRELQVACLAWLWELARRNPYVARVVAGAPLTWCERIAACPLVRLLRSAADADLVRPRFSEDSPMYRRLLLRGGSALRGARRAAQVAAMQAMLTGTDAMQSRGLPAAACRLEAPSRRLRNKV